MSNTATPSPASNAAAQSQLNNGYQSGGATATSTGSSNPPAPIALKQLPAGVGDQLVPGGVTTAQPAQPAKNYTEAQLVELVGQSVGVTPRKGESSDQYEAAVVAALAEKYNVKVPPFQKVNDNNPLAGSNPKPGLHLTGPGSLWDTLFGGDTKPPKGDTPGVEQPTSQGMNQSTLAKVLEEVGKKVGVNLSNAPASAEFDTLATKLGIGTGTPATPAKQGQPETAAEMYSSFVKSLGSGADATADKQIISQLEAAGLLDSTQLANTTGQDQSTIVANAYADLLTQSVQKKQPVAATLSTLAKQNQSEGTTTSEPEAAVQGIADEFGVYLTPGQVTSIANQYSAGSGSIAGNEDQVKAAVTALYDPTNPNNPPGLAASITNGIQNAAGDYQIPISDQAVGNMVKAAINGATVETFYQTSDSAVSAATEQFKTQAEGLYPSLAAGIKAGNTVATLTDPYKQIAAQYAGVDPASIQIDDPSGKWGKFLQGGQDPKTGAPTLMTMDAWKKTLMQDPQYGFANTQGGKDMGSQVVSGILNMFGRVATGSSNFGQYGGTPGSANSV